MVHWFNSNAAWELFFDVSAEAAQLYAGAIAAALVGYVHWNCGMRFGLPLILFYLSSSKVRRNRQFSSSYIHGKRLMGLSLEVGVTVMQLTHWRQEEKANLEAGHKEDGQRNAYQVGADGLVEGADGCCTIGTSTSMWYLLQTAGARKQPRWGAACSGGTPRALFSEPSCVLPSGFPGERCMLDCLRCCAVR